MNARHFCIALVICACSAPVFADAVTDYRTFFAECGDGSIALRGFTRNGKDYLLKVNLRTLGTSIEKADESSCRGTTIAEIEKKYKSTFYVKALLESRKNAKALRNAGFTHFLPSEKGVNLTADLCPSRFPFDRVLVTSVIDEFGKIEKPVPLGLSVTGLWMENHGADIRWLQGLERRGMISVTWINHSYNHKFSKQLRLRVNFLLEKGTVIEYEVLATEKKMIETGLLPSIFFRFPGLVSNYDLVGKITDFGLIPLGSDAWLGKKQWPKDGSIVLVHANGREPIGIARFIDLLKSKNKEIIGKHWFLYDLRESVADYEKSGK